MDMIKSMLDSTPCVVQLPIGSEENFLGVIDLVRMEAIVWDNEDLGATFQTVGIELHGTRITSCL